MADELLNTLVSLEAEFWDENKTLPDTEIRGLWDRQLALLAHGLRDNLTGGAPSSAPSKRAVPVSSITGDQRPHKRQNIVEKMETPSLASIERQVSAPATTATRWRPCSQGDQSESIAPLIGGQQLSPSHPINIPTTNRSLALQPTLEHSTSANASQSLPAQHLSGPSPLPQDAFGRLQDMSPADFILHSQYLSQSPDDHPVPGLAVTPSSATTSGESQLQNSSRLSVSVAPDSFWPLDSWSASASDWGMSTASSAPSAPSAPMSRHPTNEILVEPLQMCRIESMTSSGGFPEAPASSTSCRNFDAESPFPELSDMGLFHHNVPNTLSPPFPAGPSPSHHVIPPPCEMSPSSSQESNASSSSSDSTPPQYWRGMQGQNSHRKRVLAPRTQASKPATPVLAPKIVEVVAADGTTQKKAEICRASRPAKETTKVFCPFCVDHKDGFHGEHELRRHIDRAHKDLRKVFVCKDISPDGTFLANCKHCRNQKSYGASYNAAAHLRRVHFNPCETPKGGRGKVSRGRGGIGGGDQPSMDVLRHWMFETWETNLNGVMLAESQISNTFPSSRHMLSLEYPNGITQPNELVQISSADLDYVQKTTHLDMSFLRDINGDALHQCLHVSANEATLFSPFQQMTPFFDGDFTT